MDFEEPAEPMADGSPRLTRVPLGKSGRRLSFERRLRLWLYLLGLPMGGLGWVLPSLFWWSRSSDRCRRWRMWWLRCARTTIPFAPVEAKGMMRWAIWH